MSHVRSEPGPIWRITLSRPRARNAVSAAMLVELSAALGEAAADPGARVLLLTGEGPDFCAGADLAELEAAASGPGAASYGTELETALVAILEHPLPVVAGVQGAALGAGCQLVLACDLAVAAPDARLGIPSARLGVVIGYENVERLLLSVGPRLAAEMLLAGRQLSGAEAALHGLVNAVAEDPHAAALALAGEVAAGAPLSVRASKRGLRAALSHLSIDRATEGYRVGDFEMMAAQALSSEDLREGIRAFAERRAPRFRGS